MWTDVIIGSVQDAGAWLGSECQLEEGARAVIDEEPACPEVVYQ